MGKMKIIPGSCTSRTTTIGSLVHGELFVFWNGYGDERRPFMKTGAQTAICLTDGTTTSVDGGTPLQRVKASLTWELE